MSRFSIYSEWFIRHVFPLQTWTCIERVQNSESILKSVFLQKGSDQKFISLSYNLFYTYAHDSTAEELSNLSLCYSQDGRAIYILKEKSLTLLREVWSHRVRDGTWRDTIRNPHARSSRRDRHRTQQFWKTVRCILTCGYIWKSVTRDITTYARNRLPRFPPVDRKNIGRRRLSRNPFCIPRYGSIPRTHTHSTHGDGSIFLWSKTCINPHTRYTSHMETTLVTRLFQTFEEMKHFTEEWGEYWSARDLQKILWYRNWRNFEVVMEKAMIACREAGNSKFDHFVAESKKVSLGSDANRRILDIHLSRYAAYLIAQNGDPRKPEIAFAQAYFAVQTRKQELVEKKLLEYERIHVREKLTETEKELTGLAFERGVDGIGMARIRSRGDATLFGGNTTKIMKQKLGIPEDRSLADFLPTVLLKAKDLAAEVTNHNIRMNTHVLWEEAITREHTQNNQWVRDFLVKSGITPERLPPAIDIQRLRRQQQSEEKSLSERTHIEGE